MSVLVFKNNESATAEIALLDGVEIGRFSLVKMVQDLSGINHMRWRKQMEREAKARGLRDE